MLDSLIITGAEVNLLSYDHTHILANTCKKSDPALVKLLLDHGANVNAFRELSQYTNSCDISALHMAYI